MNIQHVRSCVDSGAVTRADAVDASRVEGKVGTGAPLCTWCEARPVKRSQHRQFSRMVNGKRWNQTCSRKCGGEWLYSRQTAESRRQAGLALAAWNRKQRVACVIRAIRLAFGEGWKGGDPVTLDQVLELHRRAVKTGWFRRDATFRRTREYRAEKGIRQSA